MTKSELEKDINIALKILYKHPLGEEEHKIYNKLYPWSNEHINKYYDYYDLTNKKALCVTSSGDHLLYAAVAGASEIDSFDINRLCKYYAALKISLILAYDQKQFFKHFINKKNCILSSDLNLEDVEPYLNEKYIIFWKEIMSTCAFKNNKFLFRFDGFPVKLNLDYELLKKNLSKIKINYYDMSTREFLEYNNNSKYYDAIFLSNVLEWEHGFNRYNLLNSFINLLNSNGVLYDYFIHRDEIDPIYMSKKDLEKIISKKVLVYRKK